MKQRHGMFPVKVFSRDTHPELPLDPDVVRPGRYRRPLGLKPSLLALVFVGGVTGTVCRYGIFLLLPSQAGHWPAATFTVNMVGSFSLGLLLEALARRGPDAGIRQSIRLSVGTGFMGAFTTYSTFAVDADLLMRHDRPTLAIAYIAAMIAGGLLCAAAGIQLAAAHHRRQGSSS